MLMLAAAATLAACDDPAAPRSTMPPGVTARFGVANQSDSLLGVGFYAVFRDSVTDRTLRDGARLVNPLAPSSAFTQRGPACHVGCTVDLRVDLFWQRRSFQLPTHRIAAPGDTLLLFRWPADTTGAAEVPYAGDAPYCLTAPTC